MHAPPESFTLLTAVSESASATLRRFDEAEVARQVHLMRYYDSCLNESLLRFFVVKPLKRARARFQFFSSTFVPIPPMQKNRSAAEVFSTVNRYTETVSRIVRAYGGTVVELMMTG